MNSRTWSVEVGGIDHVVVVESDPETKRAGVRVDGRLAAKPLSATEDERELTIGGAPYILRRVKDDFELDLSPEAFTTRRSGARSAAPPPEKSRSKTWIAYVVGALIALGLIRYGARSFQYMRVPWQPYSEADGSFTAKFPEKPREKEDTKNIVGDLWTVRSRFASYKDHFYAVEYLDLKIVVLESNAESITNRFRDGWAGTLGGKVVTRDKTSHARNPAMNFVIELPKGAGLGDIKLPV